MKKAISFCLALLLFLLPITAFCEGKLTVTHKTLYIASNSFSNYGYLFSRIENTGDFPLCVDSGKLVMFTKDDDIAATESYILPYRGRVILQPGEYAYVREWMLPDITEKELGDFKYSQPSSELRYGSEYSKLDCAAELSLSKKNVYDNDILITFKNTSPDVLESFGVVAAIFDENGDLIFVNGNSYSSIQVHEGSTITVVLDIDSDLITYYKDNDITPATVEAIVYYK